MWGSKGQLENIVKQALDYYGERLMTYPNVVGLGLSRARSDRSGNDLYVVKIYVSKKPSLFQRHIPSSLPLELSNDPKRVVSVPTEIEEIGNIELDT